MRSQRNLRLMGRRGKLMLIQYTKMILSRASKSINLLPQKTLSSTFLWPESISSLTDYL